MKTLTSILGAIAIAATGAFASVETGKPAPDFTLTDIEGNEHSLSNYLGKIVVLEWVNHGCPFVVRHYASGNMQQLQTNAEEQGVVWLTICSSAPGKQGHMSAEDAAAKIEELEAKATAYLLDEDGTVGKAYDAKTTPHMYVINEEGVLVYQGAIDDNPKATEEETKNAKNFVAITIEELLAGTPVSTKDTKPYGCSVKY